MTGGRIFRVLTDVSACHLHAQADGTPRALPMRVLVALEDTDDGRQLGEIRIDERTEDPALWLSYLGLASHTHR